MNLDFKLTKKMFAHLKLNNYTPSFMLLDLYH